MRPSGFFLLMPPMLAMMACNNMLAMLEIIRHFADFKEASAEKKIVGVQSRTEYRPWNVRAHRKNANGWTRLGSWPDKTGT
jgi:hypothetical protein